jgi:hypothetical protein
MTLNGPFSISDTLWWVIVLQDCKKITMQHRTQITIFGMLLGTPLELVVRRLAESGFGSGYWWASRSTKSCNT